MKAETIVEIYKERLRKIKRHYERLLEEFKVEEIHHFRVEVKKLRAFMRLLSAGYTAHKIILPQEIKSFYRMAGLMRNLQLYQVRISSLCEELSLPKPLLYLQSLHEEETTLRLSMAQVADNLSWKEFQNELIGNVREQLTGRTIKAFVRRSREKLEELFSLPVYYEEVLHNIRKLLKDLMYNSKYIASALTVSLPPELRSLKTIEPLTVALGDLYDLHGALNLLNSEKAKSITDVNELTVLQALEEQLQLRKNEMKEQVINRLMPVKEAITADVPI
ncbi:MAG: CHAD domain-containing protein [Flavisolibacter sp.]